MTQNTTSLILAYNADSGIFNALLDSAKKFATPDDYECSLCAVTHGFTSMRWDWRQFLGTLPAKKLFLHRNEFTRDYPDEKRALPAIFVQRDDGPLDEMISAEELQRITDLSALINLVEKRMLRYA